MFRSPRRNGRNRRSKTKHVIQISMLLGVSIWLLYQIHHSDDKKPSATTKVSHTLDNGNHDISKLGRKVLRPKMKVIEEQHQADDEQDDGKEGTEDVAEDHESEEREEGGENEVADGKEDNEEVSEMKQGEEIEEERVDGDKSNEQNKVVVMEDIAKKKSTENASEDDNDNDNDDVDQSAGGEAENDKMTNNAEDDTSGAQQPSVRDTNKQTAQQVNSAPDSYSLETNTENDEEDTKADSESEETDDVSLLEEKEALTDLETLPESRTGGSINPENAATEE